MTINLYKWDKAHSRYAQDKKIDAAGVSVIEHLPAPDVVSIPGNAKIDTVTFHKDATNIYYHLRERAA